jgi:hypothetical protein
MALAFLLALQAAAGPAAEPAVSGVTAVEFDLAEATKRQQAEAAAGCGQRGAGEILVCGRRPGAGDYPMEKWERVFREEPLVAEKGIGAGAVARAYTEQVEMGSGQMSRRAMVGVKLRF